MSETDNAFVVEVPELPGCRPVGETYQEAVANAEQVTEEWLEIAKEEDERSPKRKAD